MLKTTEARKRFGMTVKCQSRLHDEGFEVSSYELSVPGRVLVASGGGVTTFPRFCIMSIAVARAG